MLLVVVLGMVFLAGCASPARNVKAVRLGMSPDEVEDVMGEPYTVRASKMYENGEWTQIWEYMPPLFTLNPKTFWIYFENGKLVQWGEPGDFAGRSGTAVPVSEYSEQKRAR